MSCSAKQAPPGPWNDFTPRTAMLDAAGAAGAAGAAAAGAGGGVGPCAWLTEATEPSTDWAAVAVRPALVSPRTNPRRDIPCDRYLATSSLMFPSLGCSPRAEKSAVIATGRPGRQAWVRSR